MTTRQMGIAGGMGIAAAFAAVLMAGAMNHAAQAGPKMAQVGPWDAMKSAAAKVPGGKALSATYTKEGAVWMYDVIVIKGKTITEVEVNAQTGKVGDSEVVTPEIEAKEMAAELNAAIGNKAPAAGGKAKPEAGEKPEAPEKE